MVTAEASSKNPHVLAAALAKVEAVSADSDIRNMLARALRLSYESDGDSLPLAASDVVDSTSLPPVTLAQCVILLTKKNAIDYLADLGTPISLVSMRRRLSETSYVAHFHDGRTPIRAGRGGRLLITYAEARHFAGLYGRVKAPARLVSLIEKGWVDDA